MNKQEAEMELIHKHEEDKMWENYIIKVLKRKGTQQKPCLLPGVI